MAQINKPSGNSRQYHSANKDYVKDTRFLWARIYVLFKSENYTYPIRMNWKFGKDSGGVIPSNPSTVSLKPGAMSFTSCVLPFHPIVNVGKGWTLNEEEGTATLSSSWPADDEERDSREYQLREVVSAVAAPVYEISDLSNIKFAYRTNRGAGHEPKAPDGAITLAYVSAGDNSTEVSRNKPWDGPGTIEAVAYHDSGKDWAAWWQSGYQSKTMMFLRSAFVDCSLGR